MRRSTFTPLVLALMMVCSERAALAGMAVCSDGVSLNVTGARVLREILVASEVPTARVERVSNTVEEQAHMMYEQLLSLERSRRKPGLYGPGGTKAREVFDENRAKPRDKVIALMAAELSSELGRLKERQDAGERGAQPNSLEPPGYMTFDVAPSSLGTSADRERFLTAVKNHPKTITFFYAPDERSTYHIELFDLDETGATFLPDPTVPRALAERRHRNGAIAERYEQATVGTKPVKYGRYERFSEKGELLEEGFMECGRRTGEWKSYEHVKGTRYLRRDEYFQNGKNHGPAKIYWIGKPQVFTEGSYENGLKQGRWVEYTAEGLILKEETYHKGVLHGPYKIYQVALSMTGSYVRTSGNYVNGLREGRWESFGENHVLLEEGRYLHDKKDGPWKSYWDNNQAYVIYFYDRGRLISREAWDRDGNALK